MRILRSYILKELVPPFGLSLLVFTFVLLMGNIIKVADLIIRKGVGIASVGNLFLYLVPSLLSYTIPMAVLTAVLLAFGRLASDNEITAMRACGTSLYRVMMPAIVFGLILSLASVIINDRVIPKARFAARSLLAEIGKSKPAAMLEAGTFITAFKDYIIFIYEIEGNELRHVRIYQPKEGTPTRTIIANRGQLIPMPEKEMIALKLFDGTSDEPNPKDPSSFYKLNFKTYYLTMNLNEAALGKKVPSKKPNDKTIHELRSEIKELRANDVEIFPLVTEIHKKLSLAFASFAMVLIGLPLATIARRDELSIGFGIALGIFIIYYILLAFGTALALKGTLPPSLCMWSPNILLSGAGVFLIRLTGKR